jgi:hypothetical protein
MLHSLLIFLRKVSSILFDFSARAKTKLGKCVIVFYLLNVIFSTIEDK